MDIHLFLEEWNALEPDRCVRENEDDFWIFRFEQPQEPENHRVRCDVVSVHGVGIVEDLVAECIRGRPGWSFDLIFDREDELFGAQITVSDGTAYTGLESLNPGIALLSAYLNVLKSSSHNEMA